LPWVMSDQWNNSRGNACRRRYLGSCPESVIGGNVHWN
jgi:hypothetical protein